MTRGLSKTEELSFSSLGRNNKKEIIMEDEESYYCPYCGPTSILWFVGEEGGKEVYRCVKKTCKSEFTADKKFKEEQKVEEDYL